MKVNFHNIEFAEALEIQIFQIRSSNWMEDQDKKFREQLTRSYVCVFGTGGRGTYHAFSSLLVEIRPSHPFHDLDLIQTC